MAYIYFQTKRKEKYFLFFYLIGIFYHIFYNFATANRQKPPVRDCGREADITIESVYQR